MTKTTKKTRGSAERAMDKARKARRDDWRPARLQPTDRTGIILACAGYGVGFSSDLVDAAVVHKTTQTERRPQARANLDAALAELVEAQAAQAAADADAVLDDCLVGLPALETLPALAEARETLALAERISKAVDKRIAHGGLYLQTLFGSVEVADALAERWAQLAEEPDEDAKWSDVMSAQGLATEIRPIIATAYLQHLAVATYCDAQTPDINALRKELKLSTSEKLPRIEPIIALRRGKDPASVAKREEALKQEEAKRKAVRREAMLAAAYRNPSYDEEGNRILPKFTDDDSSADPAAQAAE